MTAYGVGVDAGTGRDGDGLGVPDPFEAVDALVDWDLAVATAARLVRPGPQVSREQAREVVDQLRTFAGASTGHVVAVTGLQVPPGGGVLVVDRVGWAKANVRSFRTMLAPPVAAAQARRGRTPGPVVAAFGRRVTGVEVGSLLAFLASRVLGQYDAFGEPDAAAPDAGRLMLVAPNILHVGQEMGVDPGDFRLWVCLHEETHRVQFAANPWLAPHVLASTRSLVEDLLGEPGAVADRLASAVRQLPDLLRGEGTPTSLIELVQTPEQRRRLAGLTAVMSLLEGHADVVMDDVGPRVVPSVEEIRTRFTRRRSGRGAVDQLLRRLLGLDAKMRQYADGATFVRGVVAKVGMDGFNAVWTSADTLPEPAEIADPGAWVRRVHG